MTMPDVWTLLSAPIVDLLGWTLLHFVWQGALVAALLAGVLWALRRYAPQVRYTVSLAALAGLLALPVATGALLSTTAGSERPDAALAAAEAPADSAESGDNVVVLRTDSTGRVRRFGAGGPTLARRHRAHANNLRRRMEQMRDRVRREMPEHLREQARRLRNQAERLEERADEMEAPASPAAPTPPGPGRG